MKCRAVTSGWGFCWCARARTVRGNGAERCSWTSSRRNSCRAAAETRPSRKSRREPSSDGHVAIHGRHAASNWGNNWRRATFRRNCVRMAASGGSGVRLNVPDWMKWRADLWPCDTNGSAAGSLRRTWTRSGEKGWKPVSFWEIHHSQIRTSGRNLDFGQHSDAHNFTGIRPEEAQVAYEELKVWRAAPDWSPVTVCQSETYGESWRKFSRITTSTV